MSEEKILMKILRAAVHGEEWTGSYKINGYRIYSLARIQGIDFIIFPILEQIYNKGLLEINKEDFILLKKRVTNMLLKYTQKQFSAYSLLQNMQNSGIDYILMKGDTLAYLYAYPDYRISGDIDIYIEKEQEGECCKFFENNGATVDSRAADNNERVVTHKSAGLIEVHIAHNTKTVSEIWYDNVEIMQEDVRETVLFDKFRVKCMGHTDNAINMVLHFIKHYISAAAHLRMFTDTMLFIDREYNNIDMQRFADTLERLKYGTIFKCMEYIAGTYLGLKNLPVDNSCKELAEEFLDDIFVCVKNGGDSNINLNCYNYYSDKKYNNSNIDSYKSYKNKILYKKIVKLISPDKRIMIKKYPILKKYQFLLPIMYFYRWLDFILLRRMKKIGSNINLEDGKLKENREGLINKLDMV